MADAPCVKASGGGLDEALADSVRLPVGADRDRPEEPDAAPTGRKTAANQFTVELRTEAGDVLGPEAPKDIIAVGPEILGIGRTQNVPKELQRMRRATGKSRSVSGRMLAFISSPSLLDPTFHRFPLGGVRFSASLTSVATKLKYDGRDRPQKAVDLQHHDAQQREHRMRIRREGVPFATDQSLYREAIVLERGARAALGQNTK